ncbi:MAG: hypothetical protein Q9222_006127 [Ikaeria aurantiellina]
MPERVYCRKCHRWFVKWEAYSSHMLKSSQHSWCQKCNRDFVDEDALIDHWEDSRAHEDTYCLDCGEDFRDEHAYDKHLRAEHHYCLACDIEFDSDKSRVRHWSNNQRHKHSYCADCKDDFDNADNLHAHWATLQAHHGTYDSICRIKFSTATEHMNHIFANSSKHFACPRHQLYFGSESLLESHYSTADGHPKCSRCKTGFENDKLLEEHLWVSSGHPKCTTCKRGFEDGAKKAHHFWTSSARVRCEKCKEGFVEDDSLQKHYWVSKKHGPTCDLCGTTFSSPAKLRIHWKDSACVVPNTPQQGASRAAQSIHDRSKDKEAKANGIQDNIEQQRTAYETSEAARKQVAEQEAKEEAEKRERNWMKSGNLGSTSGPEKDNSGSRKELSFCNPCSSVFESAEQLKQHYVSSDKHNYCAKCDVAFYSEEQLISHWTTSAKHDETYCARCNLHFDGWNSLRAHKESTAEKHFICNRCVKDFDSNEKLQQHFPTSSVHASTFCKVCLRDFMTEDELLKHLPNHDSKPLLCYSSCDESKPFDNVASIIKHLEDGTCSKGWTAQHINAIAAEHATIAKYINPSTLPFFLAAPPRVHTLDEDFLSFAWRCHMCNHACLDRQNLEYHLKIGLCHEPYPEVLKCIYCANEFTRLSDLVQHLEKKECETSARDFEDIVESIKGKVEKNGGRPLPLKEVYCLRINNLKQRELFVKVKKNPEVERNGSG